MLKAEFENRAVVVTGAASELAEYGIRVNAVAPGNTVTAIPW